MGIGADVEAIRTTTARLLAAVNASDVDRALDVWATDGVMMPPGHPAVRGHAGLRRYFGDLFERATFSFHFTLSEIDVAGDMAIECVGYTVVARQAGGGEREDVGKGVHVYRRQADGSWKLSRDIWNSDRRG